MSRASYTLPPSYFDQLYAADSDPWRFASCAYERAKYARTLASLAKQRYGAALEVGCSIGVLTVQLALRCDHLLAIDAAAAALKLARQRCATQPWVAFERCFAPKEWPSGRFDLIVLSEIVYYLVPDDVMRLAEQTERALKMGGEVLLVHWTGETNYPLSGDAAAEGFIAAAAGFTRIVRQERAKMFRLDLLTREPASGRSAF